ncbi:hypothetical protein DY000_02013899 [Brassica cretica]|uniref:Uncharacterized protein n=1 Tax=Brassica cretica TaxID=69181 RepID=A0ABQ7DAX8_BRACR|nr:hypothetical protein DY000_02013899 [Brassica cretica]
MSPRTPCGTPIPDKDSCIQKKEAVPDDFFCDVDQQPNMVTVSHHVSPEMKSTSPTPEELEEHYRSVTSQRLKKTRNLGAWAKPLHFTSPATPRDDNAQLGPNKASWPSLSDGSRAKTRRQQQDGKTPESATTDTHLGAQKEISNDQDLPPVIEDPVALSPLRLHQQDTSQEKEVPLQQQDTSQEKEIWVQVLRYVLLKEPEEEGQ